MSDGILGHPPNPAIAGIEALLIAGLLFAFGYLLVAAVDAKRRLGLFERAALSFPALVGYSLVLMALHVASGGRVLSNGWLVIALSWLVAGGCALLLRGRPKSKPERRWWIVPAVAATAIAVWTLPVFLLMPVFAGGDPALHAGWTNQLLNGDVLPTTPIPADVPNYYPWLFHALSASITHVTPGANPYLAQGPLQVLQPVALALGFLALGRRMFRSETGGIAAALFGGLAGGIGFLWARGPEVLMHPTAPGAADTYAGDLLFVRGPAIAFSSLAPVFPRDVALTLLVPVLLLVLLGLRRRDASLLGAGGAALGLVGLVGAEPFFVGVPLAGIAVFLLTERQERVRALLLSVGVSIALYGLWAVPILYNYIRLDGFVNTSEIGPVDLPWYGFLGAWGIAIPFAVIGAIGLVRGVWSRTTNILFICCTFVPLAVLIVAGFVPRVLGEGFTVLGRPHRYWSLVSLGVALFAARGLASVGGTFGRRRLLAIGAATCALALVSPIFATIAFTDEVPRVDIMQAALEGDEGTVFEAVEDVGTGCVVAGRVQSSLVFAYTGSRLLDYEWRPGRQNDARVRWKRSLEEIPSDTERSIANAELAEGTVDEDRWSELLARFGVDVIVTDESGSEGPRYEGLQGRRVKGAEEELLLFKVNECN